MRVAYIFISNKKNLYWKWSRSQPKATHFILFIVVFTIFLMQIGEGCCLPLAKLMPWNCCQDPCQIWEQWSWFNMGQGILFPFSWWRLQLFLGSWDVCYPEPFLCSHHLVWWHDSLLVYTWHKLLLTSYCRVMLYLLIMIWLMLCLYVSWC